jgi:hypothetical protein
MQRVQLKRRKHMIIKRGCSYISLVLVLAMFAACGGGGDGASSSGAPKAWGIAVPIELSTGDAGSPQIAVNAGGGAFVVWTQSDSLVNIWSTRYIAGYGLDTPTRISNGAGNADNPQVAIDANGNALAVWQQSGSVWANRYTVGFGWGIAAVIDSAGGSFLAMPQIAIDSSGNALVVWVMNDGSRDSIRAVRCTAGSGWGTAEFLESDAANNNAYPKLAIDSSGNALAMWQQYVVGVGGTRTYTWYNRYSAGSGWGIAEKLKTNFTGNTSSHQIAFDGRGNAMAVWTQTDTDVTISGTKFNIWASRYDVGTDWWSAAEMIETSDMNADNATIAVDANGNALASWTMFDGIRYNLWVNRYIAGVGWGMAALLETVDTGNAGNAQIAFDVNGNALAVWQQYDGTIYNIWSKCYAVATNSWDTAAPIETDNMGSAFSPRIAFDANGNALSAWQQYDGTTYNIWANRYQ